MRTYDRLTRKELVAVQERKLAALVDRLRDNTFYAPRLPSTEGPVTLDYLRSIAPTDKQAFLDDQRAAPPFGTRLGVPVEEIAMVHTTGGTSGQGRETYGLTWRDVEAAGHLSSFAFWWAGLDFQDPGAFNIGFSNSSGGNAMLRGIQAIGNVPILLGHAGFAERLELLRQFPPVGMYGTPSAINGLTQLAAESRIDLRAMLPNLRFLLTSAEPYPVDWALAMEDAWGARLFENYGATQSASAICASSCEEGAVPGGRRGRMHLYEWSFVFEIVDPDTLEPVEPGEFGELIITTLDKEASPVVRFRTRDRVRYLGWDGCACGRELMSIECGSITRYDDMLKIKGQNVWPAEMEALVLAQPGIREFRGTLRIGDKGRDELILDVACLSDVNEIDLVARLRKEFKTRFNITPQVRVVDVAELPQWSTPEAKARRFKDERSAGLSASWAERSRS